MALVFLVIEVLAAGIGAAWKRQRQSAAKVPALLRLARSRWFRRIGTIGVVLLLLSLGSLAILNTFFFEPTARYLIGRAATRSGIEVEFASARGNLFTGRLELADVRARRSEHPTTRFDLAAESLMVDLSLPSLVWGATRIESAEVRGVRGNIQRIARGEHRPWYLRKSLVIGQIAVDDSAVTWHDDAGNEALILPIEIDAIRTTELRSRWVAFDLLFHTNASGRIAGRPFLLSNQRSGQSGTTRWQFSGVPAEVMGAFIGGPFAWLTQGNVDVDTTTRWSDDRQLDMGWSLRLNQVQAAVEQVNQRPEAMDLGFTLQFEQGRFKGQATPDAAGLSSAVADAAAAELAARFDIRPEQMDQAKQKAADLVRRLVD